ncbi:NAD(P)H-dependent oxidoreductase [Pedobacter hiemivivus]|uniref:NAD(P)H-dependent oxidoreductase n=1 Tax=Pedobacter hiemivivus TaxID=2530454 RepID=A0A4U1GDK1_9SPHI|nr:NAD(P)H-dependent oxidoreductase [Pedobacter hiemivivus]TCC95559.1 NAD(P)H-dependent oxidoreductase [Pedobacter hiemivivus]TKC61019.1 NAD(P)H-dependent oxidoreductase [Pedobacter hiemivivus]
MSLIEALNWRYATKKMNGEKVSQDKVDQILAAARLAPTSSGLQPFRIIVVTNPELKEKIKAVAYGQQQITDASHVLIFAAWDNYTEERIRSVFTYTNNERGVPDSATADYVNTLIGLYTNRTTEENFHHAAKQAYIGFGVALAEAALLKVDATPMEGFESAKLDELLGLNAQGLRSTTILPLGYRDEAGDWLVNLKKVRTPLENFVTEIK